jgi:hypothetical protein
MHIMSAKGKKNERNRPGGSSGTASSARAVMAVRSDCTGYRCEPETRSYVGISTKRSCRYHGTGTIKLYVGISTKRKPDRPIHAPVDRVRHLFFTALFSRFPHVSRLLSRSLVNRAVRAFLQRSYNALLQRSRACRTGLRQKH